MDIRTFFRRSGSFAPSDERENQEIDRAEGAGVMEVSGLQVLKDLSGVFFLFFYRGRNVQAFDF